jgi:hypothetical protein
MVRHEDVRVDRAAVPVACRYEIPAEAAVVGALDKESRPIVAALHDMLGLARQGVAR